MQQSKKHTAQLETEAAEHVLRECTLTAEIYQLNTRLAVVEKEHQLSIRESQERTQQLQQEKAELENALMVLKEQTSLTESQRA